VDDGDSILVFGEFYGNNDTRRQDVVVKFDIENDTTELIQMPAMDLWTNFVFPSGDNQNLVYLFASFNITSGFYRYDIASNETEFFEVSGLKDDPSSFFWLTTTLYVKELNRLYIFGGYADSDADEFKDDIWYVDLDPITPTTTTPSSSSTTMNPDLFTCEGREDGFYPNPLDCSKYIGCHDNNGGEMMMTHYQCPPPLLFDPIRRNCNLPSFVDCDLSCEGRLDDLYPHPHDCALFLICNAFEAHVYRCPSPLLFNKDSSQCDLPQNVNCSVLLCSRH